MKLNLHLKRPFGCSVFVGLTLVGLPCLLLEPFSLEGADSPLTQAVERGVLSMKLIDLLSYDDVPAKWRSRVVDEGKDNLVRNVHYRGETKRLEVFWRPEWVGERSNMFIAVIHDGSNRVSKINYLKDRVVIGPAQNPEQYQILTVVEDSGKVSVQFQGTDGYVEGIVVDGRRTHLLDDLEYTKAALAMEHFLEPVMDSLQKSLDAPPADQEGPGL